jgi:hypothetical protein
MCAEDIHKSYIPYPHSRVVAHVKRIYIVGYIQVENHQRKLLVKLIKDI